MEIASPTTWLIQHSLGGSPLVSVARTPAGYLVRAHEVADFDVSRAGELLAVHPVDGVSQEEVSGNFSMLVEPFLHQLHGRPALHASAVLLQPAGAVAFLGPPLAGKSTLAAMMSKRYPLLADDTVPLEVDGGDLVVVPTSSRVRLRNDAAPHFGASAREWVKPSLEVTHSRDKARLAAIFQLGPQSSDVKIDGVSQQDALLMLATQLQRLDPSDPELLRSELAWLERITASVPVARLSYPRTFAGEAEIAAAISRHLRVSR